ncbi:type II/IV secretion system ATPase subunit [Methanosarcina mazei]|uniref:Flagella-related protein FlaI n=2 Tax=Methanosarcina mazei TaxID=2209 RepID=A0A0E3RIQ4_METMZ|nr:type II/IV secretion system ATPase subunit [Methanosarcina mazei]AAM30109.1 flagella related protein FlaI [Methanosarcina mazei Go1]AKB64087.1 Flagella-related protein FlaI [Methanosarcina mazei S-6]WIM43682.1 type II/IV secretion system ATPase subunit [Methanosarcina mazei]WIM47139.1 type II/IV secretion system ATPase subunit [Methanosarcina mazei]
MEALPFNPLPAPENGGRSRKEVYAILSPEMQEFVGREENHHILDYICRLPAEEIGFPEFYPRISRSMKSIKRPNLIYPAGKGLAVHIYPDKEDVRNYYIPIEPCLFQKLDSMLEEVEKLLIDVIHDQEINTNDPEEKKKLLVKALEKTCDVKENLKEKPGKSEEKGGQNQKDTDQKKNKEKDSLKEGKNDGKTGFIGNLKGAGKLFGSGKPKKISVTPQEFNAIKYRMVRDKVGMGVLEPLLLDSNIEDISCSGLGRIFVEHKVFSSLKTTISFEEIEELNSFVIQMSEKVGKPITYRDPIVDTALPDGSRINIVFGEDVSKRGSNFTIRKFMGVPISILELVEFGTIDYTMAAYMWMMLRAGMNCFVSGETASGKTTMMNAVTTFLPPDSKIVSIEDTPELQVPHKNWTREVTRTTRDDSGSDVSMFDLLKAALRQRPNEIMIGEIRGVEGSIAFQAMQTGHPVMSTFHAASVEKLIQRLTGDPINVPKNYVDNLNVVIIQSAVNVPGKGLGRRVLSINEIVGYDAVNQAFNFMDIFKWDPATDTFKFTGKNNSYLLEHKIAPRMGIPETQVRKIYSELDRRSKILRKIHQANITNFYDLFTTLIQLEEAGVIS